jgi:hypothetical protein
MIIAIVIVPLVAILLWLFAIRPYCLRNGKGFTTGANMGVTYWVDWQEATEISKAKGDGGMIIICRLVFWLHILGLGILAYTVFHSRP